MKQSWPPVEVPVVVFRDGLVVAIVFMLFALCLNGLGKSERV